MVWWLSVFFLIEGVWVPGSEVSIGGWSPRAYPTEQACLARKAFAEKQCRDFPLKFPVEWRCTAPDPLLEVPDDLRGVEC